MENAIQERIQAKTRDSQLYEIFVNQFEFSPKTAEAAINIVKEVYELMYLRPQYRQIFFLCPAFLLLSDGFRHP